MKSYITALNKLKSFRKIETGLHRVLRFVIKNRIWFMLVAFLILVFFIVGYFAGSWRAKKTMNKFPPIGIGTRLLIISPHPDDETLMAGGLIQEVLKSGGQVKIIFLTSGDGSKETVYRQMSNPDYSQEEYLTVGRERMKESLEADSYLGIPKENIIFLGFPDGGLEDLYFKHYAQSDGIFTSPVTSENAVPYVEAYKKGQQYLGKYIVQDVKEITDDFKPNIMLTTDLKDGHPDHRTAFYIAQRTISSLEGNLPLYTAIVHYKGYPNKGDFLWPPGKIFSTNWFNLDLSQEERDTKKAALLKYVSQNANPVDKALFRGLSARNEIYIKEQDSK